jgi:protein SCO1
VARQLTRHHRGGLVAALLLVIGTAPVQAERQDTLPPELEGVGVREHLGAQVPLDTELVDETGAPVRLSSYFHLGRPVLLTLNYYECPMLCTLQLNGLVDALRSLAWTPGREFEIVTVSINPLESPALARAKKGHYLESLERPAAAQGWHFLTGRQPAIRAVADSVGFAYRYDVATGQYVHAAAFMLLTPDGTVARYLYGVLLEPETLRLALVEAGRGAVGTTRDQLILTCFHYDGGQGRYVVAAGRLMRLGAGGAALLLGGWLGAWWLAERRRAATTTRPASRSLPAPPLADGATR